MDDTEKCQVTVCGRGKILKLGSICSILSLVTNIVYNFSMSPGDFVLDNKIRDLPVSPGLPKKWASEEPGPSMSPVLYGCPDNSWLSESYRFMAYLEMQSLLKWKPFFSRNTNCFLLEMFSFSQRRKIKFFR